MRCVRRAESIPAAYVARVLAPSPEFDAASIPRVVQYDDDTVEFERIEPAGGEGANRWFRVESHRAHRRAAVRALFESRGLKVSRVIQVQFAGLELPRDLPRGRHRALSEKQVAKLYEIAGLPAPPTAQGSSRAAGCAALAVAGCALRSEAAHYWQSTVCPVTPRLSGPSRKR